MLTLQQESRCGVGLRPLGLLGHAAVTTGDEDGLARGRGWLVRWEGVRFFGRSLNVHFGTHCGVPVLSHRVLESTA